MVMDSLGIDVGASESDNMQTFKKMTVDTGVFTYDELVVWFRTLSKLRTCQGLAVCAEDYARRLVTEDEMDQGYYWLKQKDEFWLSFMKRSHVIVLTEFGLDREVQLPFIGTPGDQIPVRSLAAGASSSYGYTYPPTPQVPTGASGVQAAMAGFAMRRPEVPQPPLMSTVTSGTAGSEVADALLVSMNNFTNKFTEQMREQVKETVKYQQESAKSQQVLSENTLLDKPVHGILELQPEMGYKLTVHAFLTWLKSVEEAWGKVSASVTQVIAKLRGNLRTDEHDLRSMLSDKMNERLFTSLSDKVGGTLKKTVWPSQRLDGVGYLFAVLKVALEPDQRDWSNRLAAFYNLPEIVPAKHMHLEIALQDWLKLATEVIYSHHFTAETATENLRKFLRYYPDLVASVESLWRGSTQDYEVLEQIFVQLKREVAEATSSLSKATKHRWGTDNAPAAQEDNAPSKTRNQGKGGKGRGRRGSTTDAEKEPTKEDSRKRSTSEPDISAAWKKKNPTKCYQYFTTGTCDFGEECRFEHVAPLAEPAEPKRGGRGSHSTKPSPSQNTSKGSRYAQAPEADWSEDEDDQQELIRLRKENAELRGRWLVLCSPCSNPNPNPNPGRVVRVLRTMVHGRGHNQTVRPAIDPKKTFATPGGTLTEKGDHDELGWPVVCRKPKSRKNKQRVVHGTYNAPKLLLDYHPNPNPNHPLTLKATSVKPKQAPSFQRQLRIELAAERESQGLDRRARKGPIVDGGSNVCITAGRERNLLENIRSAPKIKIDGIAGSVEHSGEVGDRKVGPIQIMDSIIVKDAKESVIDYETLWNNGVTGLVVTPDSQVMLFEEKKTVRTR